MSVAILIICHQSIGSALQDTITTTMGTDELPLRLESFAISSDTDPDVVYPEISNLVEEMDTGDGVLILTDLYGSTPCNIAKRLQEKSQINVITGLNLPMLLRIMNYADQNLDELTETALRGGQEGIVMCEKNPDINLK